MSNYVLVCKMTTNLHSYEKCAVLPCSLQGHQNLLSLVFLVLAFIPGVQWLVIMLWFIFFVMNVRQLWHYFHKYFLLISNKVFIYFWDFRLHFRLSILTFCQMYDVLFVHLPSNHNSTHISPRNRISMSKKQLSSWLNCGSIYNSYKMIGGLTKLSTNFQWNVS